MSKPLTGTILDFLSHSDFDTPTGFDDNGVVTRGQPAKHHEVVQYVGPWSRLADGLGEHTRRSARALAQAGEIVHLVPPGMEQDVDPAVEAQVGDLMHVDAGSYRLRIIQGVLSNEFVSKYVTHRFMSPEGVTARNSATVLYVVAEHENGSADTARLLNRARMVWTSCERTRAMLEKSGVDSSRLHVVPVPYFANDPLITLRHRKRSPGVPRFLHIGKWEPRKAQHDMLGSFLMAFRPGEAQLVIKTRKYAPQFPSYPQSVGVSAGKWLETDRVKANGWTKDNLFPHVRMVTDVVPAETLRAMYSWCDVYLSLAHGEGFDMPAFDAKIAGKRLVYTASGGPEDFATEGDIAVPSEGSEPVDPWYQWPTGSTWTKVTAEGCVDSLRRAALAVQNGEPVSPVSDAFAIENVGARMKALLENIGRAP